MKPIIELSPGDLFRPDYDPNTIYLFAEYGENVCHVYRFAFLMQGTWHLVPGGQREKYNSYAQVHEVNIYFLFGGDA